LVIYASSFAVITRAQSNSRELLNASIGIVEEDNSALSRRIAHAFLPPYFRPPQPTAERNIVHSGHRVDRRFILQPCSPAIPRYHRTFELRRINVSSV